MSTQMMRETVQSLLGPARQLQTEHVPQIQHQAASFDVADVMSMVRGA